jgi:hypothetical protein
MFCQSENHQNHSIILLSNILIPKNQLDFFKKNIDNSYKIRNKIEENINKIINELKEKEESLKKLIGEFNKYLDIKLNLLKLFFKIIKKN